MALALALAIDPSTRATMPTRSSDSGRTLSSIRIVVLALVWYSTPLTHTLPKAVMLPTDTSAPPVPPMPPSPPPQATRTAASAPCTSARKVLNFISGLLTRVGSEAFLEVVDAHAHARLRRTGRWLAVAALGEPAVESFQQRLRLRRAELAELRQCRNRDMAVHHLALETRIGVAVLDVVVDGVDEIGHIGTENRNLVDRAALRHVGARHQREAAIVAALHSAHAQQLIEYRPHGHVTTVALDERSEAGVGILCIQRLGFAARVEEVVVARPGRQHTRGAVVAL